MDKKLIAAAVASALAVPMSAQAVEISASGHVNRVIRHIDGPGMNEGWNHDDSAASGSRFRFTGTEDIAGDMTVGVNFEFSAAPTNRHSAVSLGGNFGKLTMGHTGPATNATTHDVSSSGLAVGFSCPHAENKEMACETMTQGRTGVLRYDSPTIGGVGSFSMALGKDLWDANIKASGSLGNGTYSAGIYYADDSAQTDGMDTDDMMDDVYNDINRLVMGAGYKMASGTSVSVLWGDVDKAGEMNDYSSFGIKVGHDWGDNGVAVLYRRTDMNSDSMGDPNALVFGFQHKLAGGAAEVHAGYHIVDPDKMMDNQKTRTFAVGMRVKFQ
ncbi:MAG: porin [Ectothiorhodospiraceae bacterium AqS1]|nr:porin [Ectothiorhodospiraceae bacterium AqS1]